MGLVRIEDDRASVIMDGETFTAVSGQAIVLRPTRPVRFLHIGRNLRVPDAAPADRPLIAPQPAAQSAGASMLSDAR